MALQRDHFRLNSNRAPPFCSSMIFLKERFPLLQIMLSITATSVTAERSSSPVPAVPST